MTSREKKYPAGGDPNDFCECGHHEMNHANYHGLPRACNQTECDCYQFAKPVTSKLPPGSPAEKCMSCGCAKNRPAPSVCMSVRAHVVPEPVPTEGVRTRFEAWASRRWAQMIWLESDQRYYDRRIQDAWEAWTAALDFQPSAPEAAAAENCYTRICGCTHPLISHAVSGRCIAQGCLCTDFQESAAPIAPAAERLSRVIVQRIVVNTIRGQWTRNIAQLESDPDAEFPTEDELVLDALALALGEDIGCLSEEDKGFRERVDVLWLEDLLTNHVAAPTVEELVQKLTSISRITAPGNRTLDDFMRDMGYANDIARSALARAEEYRKGAKNDTHPQA